MEKSSQKPAFFMVPPASTSGFSRVFPAILAFQALLRDVVELFATERAFAARTADGRLVAWGDAAYGGSGQLNHVEMVQVLNKVEIICMLVVCRSVDM